MKILHAAAFAALLLSSPVIASAATVRYAANQQESSVAAGDPPAISFAQAAARPDWTATLSDQDGVHLTPLVGLNQNPNIHPLNPSSALLNATGGGN